MTDDVSRVSMVGWEFAIFLSPKASIVGGGKPKASRKIKKYVENVKKYEGKIKKYDGICRKYEGKMKNMKEYV